MAKKTIGSVYKGKKNEQTGKTNPDYIKITQDVTIKAGTFLNLETKAEKLASVQWLLENGHINEADFEKRTAAINKQPDFVRFDVVLNTDG